MPLKSPSRLPRRLNRPTSAYTRSLVRRKHVPRRGQTRGAAFAHLQRRAGKIGRLVVQEFMWWFIVLLGVFIACIVYLLLFSPYLDVKQIRVARQDARIDAEAIQHTLAPLFSQRLFLVTKENVSELLLTRFPDITDISIEKEYPSTLGVTLTLDPLIAALDIHDPEGAATGTGSVTEGSGAALAYLTRKGHVVLSRVALTSSPLQQLTIVDWGSRPEHGTKLFDESFILNVFEARASMEREFGYDVTEIVIFQRGKEFHLQTPTIAFWLDVRSTLDEHIARFQRFLLSVNIADVKEYVDLRLSDRVVYR